MKDLVEQGLLTWLAAAAAALTALVVLALALFSPRTDSSLTPPQFADATSTPAPIPGEVTATVETEPVPHESDAADDVAIWVHPTDPSLSTVLGTDKLDGGGLGVYDLTGQQLYFYFDGNLNNVDVRYNFPLGGARVSLVAVTNRADPPSLIFYSVNAERPVVGEGRRGASGRVRRRGAARADDVSIRDLGEVLRLRDRL